LGTAETATANPASTLAGPPADRYELRTVDLRPEWDLCQALGLNVRTRVWTFQSGQAWHTVPESYRPPRYDLGRLERDLCLICRVPGFERTGDSGFGLCNQHGSELRRLNLTLEQYLARGPAPLPTFGRCRALQNESDLCPRWATASTHRLCSVHSKRWRKLGKPDVDEWVLTPQPIKETTPGNLIDLSGLNEVQFQQVCWAIQTDYREHVVVPIGNTKHAVNWLRDHGSGRAISDIDPGELQEVYWTRLTRWIGRARWALATGDDELQRPVIRLGVLNPKYRNRTVDISDVPQPWLLQLATLHIRHVAAVGNGATKIAESGRLIRWWSAYLRTLGDLPPAKITSEDACDGFARWLQRRVMDSIQYLKLEGLEGRAAVVAQAERHKITARLIPPHPNSRVSGKKVLLMTATNRGNFLRQLNMLLLTHIDYLRELGGHAPGWRVSKAQMSSQNEEGRLNRQSKGLAEEDKALPSVVFDQLVAHLGLLGADGLARNAVEALLHLGRRPEDQMNFPFNCLAVVTDVIDGEERSYPRLRYTDRIKDGKGGHIVDIPVFERAAAVIRRQQEWLRRTYPRWFDDLGEPLNPELRLFPKSVNNRDGTVPLSGSAINSWIRQWVGKGEKSHAGIQQTPKIVGPDGTQFPLVRITAYALRHTFGQDLHDAGVPLDTIQRLMGHDTVLSTQVYARPTMADQWTGLKRLEQARSARITGDGNVVMLPIPTTLADHEEITRATMDCGSCAEKGNVARHGSACQFGKECLNCFFFRATVSDLPDLHRTRHRKARMLVQQRARLMPQDALANASTVKLQLEVERLDDLIAILEQEICSSDMVTEDDRQMIWDTLDRMERIDR
jgi:hypothetical protein